LGEVARFLGEADFLGDAERLAPAALVDGRPLFTGEVDLRAAAVFFAAARLAADLAALGDLVLAAGIFGGSVFLGKIFFFRYF
jgi:hypothetical protein